MKNRKNIANSLPKAIFNKVFEGDLVPKDSYDEPAIILLGRIREEKEKISTKK